mmetsp:Transcript_24833/g.58944  ORF Transcript_24833/g.58944 Transcript_24833/m.58944 type:complete len:122 (-) Transcript_24833:1148-1513(-)
MPRLGRSCRTEALEVFTTDTADIAAVSGFNDGRLIKSKLLTDSDDRHHEGVLVEDSNLYTSSRPRNILFTNLSNNIEDLQGVVVFSVKKLTLPPGQITDRFLVELCQKFENLPCMFDQTQV